jgi:hypothetical protein
MPHRWILCWALTPLLGLPAFAQSVISAHSGLVHFSDGAVFLDDQRVDQAAGKFDQMNNGSELRTEQGRAEVLLTPGTFLRVGSNSAIRMLSNKLEDTRVELLRGSAVLDQDSDALPDTSVTVLFNLDQVRIEKSGRYRFDSEPPQVKVQDGKVLVTADGKSIEAVAGDVVPFDGKLTARKLLHDSGSAKSGDDLDTWAEARNHSVDQSNQEAAATSDLSGVIDGWNNNPDTVLQSLGIPPYIPGMSSMVPPPGYGAYGSGAYGSGPYGSGSYGSGLYGSGMYGSGLYGSPLYFSALYPYSLYGLGTINPLLVYGMPLYRPYRSYPSGYGYRGSTPGRTGVGRVGYGYGGYTPPRSIIMRPGVGIGAGHMGVGGHVGGHR